MDTIVILSDNGSLRPAATLSLRRIAAALSRRLARPVHPVSLQHADRIDAGHLAGKPAHTLAGFLRWQAEQGARRFVVVPLFFGPSRAVTGFIPQVIGTVQTQFTNVHVQMAQTLCPLPAGEPRLVEMLLAAMPNRTHCTGGSPLQAVLVDHGSPSAPVTAVRHWLADALRQRLPDGLALRQAVMERRAGAEYDFNGALLADTLHAIALDTPGAGPVQVLLSLLFLLPGRHAGPGGDIADIVAAAQRRHPRLHVVSGEPLGEQPLLIDILTDRLQTALGHP